MESSIQIVNCIKINTDAIKEGLNKYVARNGVDPSFIVVNIETLNLLRCDSELETKHYSSNDQYPTFWGIRIAVCDALKLGEVEIV